jgi:hypothetical protein
MFSCKSCCIVKGSSHSICSSLVFKWMMKIIGTYHCFLFVGTFFFFFNRQFFAILSKLISHHLIEVITFMIVYYHSFRALLMLGNLHLSMLYLVSQCSFSLYFINFGEGICYWIFENSINWKALTSSPCPFMSLFSM